MPSYQEKAVASSGLLSDRPQLPLNLMGPMTEEEQRCWGKGANSDTSLRLYKKVRRSLNLFIYMVFDCVSRPCIALEFLCFEKRIFFRKQLMKSWKVINKESNVIWKGSMF